MLALLCNAVAERFSRNGTYCLSVCLHALLLAHEMKSHAGVPGNLHEAL